jgi:hypothetical protein
MVSRKTQGGRHMKFGMRKVSPMKSFKARTTGRAKRAVKKAIIPGYGIYSNTAAFRTALYAQAYVS